MPGSSVAAPAVVIARYADILRTFYSGQPVVVGLSQLRPLIERTTSSARLVEAANAGTIVVLLAGVCVLGIREGRQMESVLYSAPALAESGRS